MNSPPRPAATPGRQVTLLLLALLLAVNAAAVWGIVQARASARRMAAEDLQWQTRAHARAVEAALATLRGDFLFLSRTPPLSEATARFHRDDPVARRWDRLEVEGTLLLFLEAHPPVTRLEVRDAAGAPLAVAGRRAGAPILLPPDSVPAAAERRAWVRSAWPLAEGSEAGGRLEASIDPAAVLARAAPGFAERLTLVPGAEAAPAAEPPEALAARAPVAAEGWSPPLAWTLTRREEEGGLLGSVEALAGLFGTAVTVNLAVIALAFGLALLAFRQVRRAAALEAENEHQARLRELERQVFHGERLASLGRMAAGLAHEVNNPLEGMANYLLVLEEDLAAGRGAEAARIAARVREGMERIAGITRRVLAFAAPGKAPKQRLDLAEVLRHAAGFVAAGPRLEGTDLRLDLPSAPMEVMGDATTLGQLALNLLLNAAQAQGAGTGARDPGGAVVDVRLEAGGGRALLSVADRGPGLSAEALAHAFEPFFSTRGSSGLGLAVCRGIAEDHGGSIRAGNRPGGGALFEVELPLAPAAAPAPVETPVEAGAEEAAEPAPEEVAALEARPA